MLPVFVLSLALTSDAMEQAMSLNIKALTVVGGVLLGARCLLVGLGNLIWQSYGVASWIWSPRFTRPTTVPLGSIR